MRGVSTQEPRQEDNAKQKVVLLFSLISKNTTNE